MRVGAKSRSLHRLQTGDLVFLPPLAMHSRSLAGLTRQHPTTVQADHRHFRCRRRRRLTTMMHEIFHVAVTPRRHLQTDFFRQPIHMPAADRQVVQHIQQLGRFVMRFYFGRRVQDVIHRRRTVAMLVQLQHRTLREKNPDDKSGSNTSAREEEQLLLWHAGAALHCRPYRACRIAGRVVSRPRVGPVEPLLLPTLPRSSHGPPHRRLPPSVRNPHRAPAPLPQRHA